MQDEGVAAHEAAEIREHRRERIALALLDAGDLGVQRPVRAELVLELGAQGGLDRHGRALHARSSERRERVDRERAVGHGQQVGGLGGNHYRLLDHWLLNAPA